MIRWRWSCLLVGVMVTTAVGCRPIPRNQEAEATLERIETIETAVFVPQPTPSLTMPVQSTDTPAPVPVASPTLNNFAAWQQVPAAVPGWQISIPPDWVALTAELKPAQTATPYGVMTLLAADSERTGVTLLAKKPVAAGSFVIGVLLDGEPAVSVPLVGLQGLLGEMEATVTPLGPATGQALSTTDASLVGAAVDVIGHPLPFVETAVARLRTRILYYLPAPGDAGERQQVLLLFSAPADQWASYDETFTTIAQSMTPGTSSAGASTTRLRSNLIPEQPVSSSLQRNGQDVWPLSIDAPQYLTLRLKPESDRLDLAATIVDPFGNEMVQVDNAFSNSSERIVDFYLPAAGLYLVVVSEFEQQSGGYSLEIALAAQPQFSGRGQITLEESVQNNITSGGRHLWFLAGTAGQTISIVLEPLPAALDVILNVYAPDGTRLVALDEGFSGDPEVVSGLQLPLTGEYTIVVSSFSQADGDYALAVNQGQEQTLSFFDAGDLVYGQTRREMLRAYEAHAWFFQGQAGDDILVEAVPLDDLDLDVWLIDPDIRRVAAADKFFRGEPEMLHYRLSRDGQYIVLVREFAGNPGSYEVSLGSMPGVVPAYQGTLVYGQSVDGVLAAGQTVFWLFDGDEDELVDIVLQPLTGADLTLTVKAPDGTTMLTVDEVAAGWAEIVTDFRLTDSGQWRVQIQEFFDEEARYELEVSAD